MTSGSPVTAAYPARLVRSTGIVNSTNGASGLEKVWASRKRRRLAPCSEVSTRYRLPASDCVMRRACVRIRSSSVLRSRSVPRATPIRVSSPISRLRSAASARARPVSARAAASRNPARMATRSCRSPAGWFTNAESRSIGSPSATSRSPSRPSETTLPPASTNARRVSVGNVTRLAGSSRNTVGRSLGMSSRGRRTGRASTLAARSASATAAGLQVLACSSR